MDKKKYIFIVMSMKERYGRTNTDPFRTLEQCPGLCSQNLACSPHAQCFCSALAPTSMMGSLMQNMLDAFAHS